MTAILEIVREELEDCGVDSVMSDEYLTFEWDALLRAAAGRISDEELFNWDIRCATNLLHRLEITGFTNDNIYLRVPTYADMNEDGNWAVAISECF